MIFRVSPSCISGLILLILFILFFKLWVFLFLIILIIPFIKNCYKALKESKEKQERLNYQPKDGETYKVCPFCSAKLKRDEIFCFNCKRHLP